MRLDYIIMYIMHNIHIYHFELPIACNPTRIKTIVVEPSPIRSLAADFPLKKSRGFNLALIQIIFSVFTTITLELISSLCCGLFVFRDSQQLDNFLLLITKQCGVNVTTVDIPESYHTDPRL